MLQVPVTLEPTAIAWTITSPYPPIAALVRMAKALPAAMGATPAWNVEATEPISCVRSQSGYMITDRYVPAAIPIGVKPTRPSITGVTARAIGPEAIQASNVENCLGLARTHALSLSLNPERSSLVNSIFGTAAWPTSCMMLTLPSFSQRSPAVLPSCFAMSSPNCAMNFQSYSSFMYAPGTCGRACRPSLPLL